MMPVIDFHCDTLTKLQELKQVGLRSNSFSVDVYKLKQANSIAQFFAVFIDIKQQGNPMEKALSVIDRFYLELEVNQDSLAPAFNYQDYLKNKTDGKISAFLTLEDGGIIKGSLAALRNFYRLGVRLLTLTWNYPNELGFSNRETGCENSGLTPFGEEVVREMNRLGMIVDVSHLADEGFWAVVKVAQKPFIASHSNARSIFWHRRNLTDEMVKVLAERGGLVGINFAKSFLGLAPNSRVDDIVSHILHVYHIGGIEVLALGSDFDGICDGLEIEDIGKIDKLLHALKKAGLKESEIDKFSYLNAERFMREVF